MLQNLFAYMFQVRQGKAILELNRYRARSENRQCQRWHLDPCHAYSGAWKVFYKRKACTTQIYELNGHSRDTVLSVGTSWARRTHRAFTRQQEDSGHQV